MFLINKIYFPRSKIESYVHSNSNQKSKYRISPSQQFNYINKPFKTKIIGTGELDHELRALATLPEELGFNSQHLYGSSQPYVAPVPFDPMPSSRLYGYQACKWCRQTCRHNTHKLKIKIKI